MSADLTESGAGGRIDLDQELHPHGAGEAARRAARLDVMAAMATE